MPVKAKTTSASKRQMCRSWHTAFQFPFMDKLVEIQNTIKPGALEVVLWAKLPS